MSRASDVVEIVDRQKRIVSAMNEGIPEVGIFFVLNGVVMQSSLPYTEGVVYDKFITGPADHYSFWEQAQKWNLHLQSLDYEEVPRGRVVYDSVSKTFVVYASKAFVNDPKLRSLILSEFSLRSAVTKFKSDEHYEKEASWD